MAFNVGFKTIAGVEVESVYGTEIQVTASLPIVSESLLFAEELTPRETLVGFSGYRGIRKAATIGSGDVVFEHTADLDNPVLVAGMGLWTNGTPDIYSLVDQKTSSITLALRRDISNAVYTGIKANTFTLNGTPADGCRVTLGTFFQSRLYNTIINTNTILNALPLPGNGYNFEQVTMRIADLADALAGGDAVDIGEYTLTSTWNMEQRRRNSTTLYEPRENGRRLSTLSVTLPFDETDIWETRRTAQTNLQADIAWNNGTVTQTLRIPLMQVTNVTGRNIAGPGAPSPTVEFTILVDTDALNAFTGFTFGSSTLKEYNLSEV